MGTGQFCTNPGLVLLVGGETTEKFVAAVSTAVCPGARPERCSAKACVAISSNRSSRSSRPEHKLVAGGHAQSGAGDPL